MKEISQNNIFCAIDSSVNNNKIDVNNIFCHLTLIDARGTLELEAGAKNSDFMVIMGINRFSMKRGMEWATQMQPTSILPVLRKKFT